MIVCIQLTLEKEIHCYACICVMLQNIKKFTLTVIISNCLIILKNLIRLMMIHLKHIFFLQFKQVLQLETR